MGVHLLAEVNGIPYTTFQTHITSVDGKRIKPGSGVGKKLLLNALFAHMVAFRARHGGTERPSQFLDAEMTDDQARILAPTMQDLSVQAILKDAGGEGATKKLAQRKLNTAGAITSHCGLQNHPERVNKLISALELTASLAGISALTKANKHKDKCKADTELLDLAPASL